MILLEHFNWSIACWKFPLTFSFEKKLATYSTLKYFIRSNTQQYWHQINEFYYIFWQYYYCFHDTSAPVIVHYKPMLSCFGENWKIFKTIDFVTKLHNWTVRIRIKTSFAQISLNSMFNILSYSMRLWIFHQIYILRHVLINTKKPWNSNRFDW